VVDFTRDELRGAPFRGECVEHDLRGPLPPALRRGFDTVVTDPPYTTAAARLFLSRAAEALHGPGATVFLSFGSRRPGVSFALQRAITESGFVIRGLVRDFNDYVGAGVLGGTSHLYHLTATNELRPLVTGRFDGPIYTADRPREKPRSARRTERHFGASAEP
jgi:predicted methyltransferase